MIAVVAGYAIYNHTRQPARVPALVPTNFRNMKPMPTSLITRLTRDGIAPPSPALDQVEPYLRANRRSADSLLAAFCITGDQTLLREALERYPKDPKVCFKGYLTGPYNSTNRWPLIGANGWTRSNN